MATISKKRIWGWMSFDWASQPFYTLGLTFVFGPYFASVVSEYFMSTGIDPETAKAQTQSTWSAAQTVAGLFIAFTAPFLGAFADNSGRKIPWIAFFSVIYIVAAAALWGLAPDGSGYLWYLAIFFVGFIAAESALNFVNAILPSLGTKDEIGRISGSGAAFGYWGGVIALFVMLLLFVEFEAGKTILGNAPPFGLDGEQREGTRAGGPLIAIWFAIFMVPFFLYVKDDPKAGGRPTNFKAVASDLWGTLKSVVDRKSLLNFLTGSMFYRDALNALYAYGGFYATLVLGWGIRELVIFGIVSAITAAVATWVAGLADKRFGPKPVIIIAIWVLIIVSSVIVGMSREHLFSVPLAEGSSLPDIIFFICGACIGGAGGAAYAASRSMMVRHTHPERPTEAFGLFALSGKATSFIAPLFIGLFSYMTNSAQLGFLPVIFLFLIGLFLLRWVNPEGDRDEWST